MTIQIALANVQNRNFGELSVPFPIPRGEYDKICRLLNQLRVGDPLAADCFVTDVQSTVPFLKQLEGSTVNLDEMDYLAQRLDSFDDRELAQFQAAAHAMALKTVPELINLTFCCQEATVITSFHNLTKIGIDHYLTLAGCCTEAELALVDGRAVALQLLAEEAGEITPYGVLYRNDMELEQLYDGRFFPEYHYGEDLLTLEFQSEGHRLYLCLPMAEQQLWRYLLRVTGDEIESDFTVTEHRLPLGLAELWEQPENTVYDLNKLCIAYAAIEEQAKPKLTAALEMTMPETLPEAVRVMENLKDFDYIAGVFTPEDYGRHLIQESGRFEYDPHLEEVYDYRRMGLRQMEQECYKFAERGYVSYHGTLSLDELLMGDPVEEQGMEMGELL